MGQEDVLIEVIINGKDMLQFYSTKENYKALYEDRDALIDTVKTAFKEGILYSADITNVEDIHSVQFLSEVTDVTVDASAVEQILPDGEQFETYEVVEEATNIPAATSTIPEELIIDCDLNSDERLNLCSHCDYRTFNVGHFKIHMRQHTGESPFECNQCDYKSKQKSNLKRHMRQHLLGKDHFECKLCNFTCTQEKVYKRHMILHSRTRPLKPCPFCDYFSTSLAHLTVHIRQHTGETPYHCGLCSYKTVQKSNLTRHLNKHRRGRTSKADKLRGCVYCSYRTPNPAHLLAHIRAAHTGETPYACHICSYKSAQRSNLKRHLRKHSDPDCKNWTYNICRRRRHGTGSSGKAAKKRSDLKGSLDNTSTICPIVGSSEEEIDNPVLNEIEIEFDNFHQQNPTDVERPRKEIKEPRTASCPIAGDSEEDIETFERRDYPVLNEIEFDNSSQQNASDEERAREEINELRSAICPIVVDSEEGIKTFGDFDNCTNINSTNEERPRKEINLKRREKARTRSPTHSEERPKWIEQIADEQSSPDDEFDDTDQFFMSMAKQVKELPPYQRAELRMQISTLVGKAELRHICRQNVPSKISIQPEISVPSSRSTKVLRGTFTMNGRGGICWIRNNEEPSE